MQCMRCPELLLGTYHANQRALETAGIRLLMWTFNWDILASTAALALHCVRSCAECQRRGCELVLLSVPEH